MRRVRQIIVPFALAIYVASASAASADPRHAAMVIDANSGQILHAQSADEPRFPASLTKMMTLYMAFELIDAGRLNYGTKIKISQEAAAAAPSKLDLDPGEEIAAIDAIKALITKSANDIAIAVAEHIGGTEANFARQMTARARQIGMTNTTFRNASGLPDPGQTTTARDMLTLALRLQDDFPRHYDLFKTRSFSYNGGTHRNHNTLLGSFAGTDGIKTGYTRASGFNLVSSVRRDGRHLVAVVFGGSSAASRNAQMRALLTRAFGRASTEKTRKPVLVAKPRLAPRRVQVAAKPTPPAATAAQEPAQPIALKRVAGPAPSAPAAPNRAEAKARDAEPVVTTVAEATPSPRIDIAKVRRVMVAPRFKPRAPAEADSTEEPGMDAAAIARPSVPAGSAPAADDPARYDETVLAKSTPRRRAVDGAPQRLDPPELPALTAVATPAAEPPAAAVPAFAAASAGPAAVTWGMKRTLMPASTGAGHRDGSDNRPGEAPGRAPSTLQQQAMLISSGGTAPKAAAAPSYRLQGPSPAPAPAPEASPAIQGQGVRGRPQAAQGFQIQVGAFATEGEADRQLAAVKTLAGGLLQSRQTLALPVRKGDRQLYRARFAGFDANGAASTCLELRRRGVDCFVMRAE